MDYLPLFHKLQGRDVLLVGGGEIALRKARMVLDSGAVLRVVAPSINDELHALVAAQQDSACCVNIWTRTCRAATWFWPVLISRQ